MKVILTKDVPGFGRSGDVKEVSDGHARNFLIPKRLALPATTNELTRIHKEQEEKQGKLLKLQERSVEVKKQIENKTFEIRAKASKQKLFAQIHENQIADAINQKLNIQILPQQIIIKQPVKTLGQHTVEIKLTESIHAEAKIQVQAHAA